MSDQQEPMDEPLPEAYEDNAGMEEKEVENVDDNYYDDDDPGEEHVFEIIDQVDSEEEDGGKESGKDGQGQRKDGIDGDDYSSSGDEVDDSEVHEMLEKGINKETIRKDDRLAPIIKQKIVLKEFESDPFDILPEGWVCVTHNCGMPVYLHKESRVCTMARPYSLGSASARSHDIPISAIPCLQYRKQLDKEKAKTSNTKEVENSGRNPSEVTDIPDSSPIDVHKQSPRQDPKPTDQKVQSCPQTTTEAKPSQQKLWVVTEESSQKCPLDGQKEALHTGTSDFSSEDDHVKLFKDSTVNGGVGFPQSPGEDNIAVSFDTSSLDSSCLELASKMAGENSSAIATCSQSDSHYKCPEFSTETSILTNQAVSASQEGLLSVGSLRGMQLSEHVVDSLEGLGDLRDLPIVGRGLQIVDNVVDSREGFGGLEEGEIVEEGSLQETGCKESSALSLTPSKPCEAASSAVLVDPVIALIENDQSGFGCEKNDQLKSTSQVSDQQSPCIVKSDRLESGLQSNEHLSPVIDRSDQLKSGSQENDQLTPGFKSNGQQSSLDCSSINNLAHVVREEASSSTEPSEMVTSSSNSLASIKRKIESLKSRRGGKQRKLEGGSAVGWPTENNIAVSPIKVGVGDEQSAAANATAGEKLKVHAAEVKIKSAEERAKESLLDSKTIHDYCTALFQFKTLEVKKYRSWRERRRHIEERSRRSRPELPPSTKLITCPIPSNLRPEDGGENVKKREFILNPTGKSYLCILHEYMQRTLKIQPLYVFKELENSKTPYGATVTISNIEYGTGYASSKKVAKQEAAKETLKVLIPDLFKKISDQEIKRNNISDLSFFDEIKVTDPRVNDLGNKVGQPSPFQLLLECLRRNFGMGNTQCEVSTKPLKNQKCEFTINVGKHSATVVAKNKREGKQLAAQAILAKLHPHVPSWGSLLRLYGTSVQKPVQKPEEINDVKSHAPNLSVLESLREEMRKLYKQKEAIQPKGKMVVSSKHLPGKLSGVDL